MTQARLVAPCHRSLRLDKECIDQLVHHIVELVFKHSSRFVVIHFHNDYPHFPLSRRQSMLHLTTLHGRLDIPDLLPLYQEFSDIPVVSVSDAQRRPLPRLNWQGTVYHGLPEDLYRFHDTPGAYFAFLGRISPKKRVDRAIEIAKAIGMEIKIAAKVDTGDRAYFKHFITPLLEHPLVEYIGEIGDSAKEEFLGSAYALLFPIDWPEPFGLVIIEAMACGTPVIAYCHGSIPEVIEDGGTGFVVNGREEAIRAAKRIATLSRNHRRRSFE